MTIPKKNTCVGPFALKTLQNVRKKLFFQPYYKLSWTAVLVKNEKEYMHEWEGS